MSYANQVLSITNQLPVKTQRPVHDGKIRSVYWLTSADSRWLISEKGYPLPADTPLAVMVISDRISAFDCIWQAEGGLAGVPGKGSALNALSTHWFDQFKDQGIGQHHIVDHPHPLVWLVQAVRPVKIEAIARQYMTGSLWRAYTTGERSICGIELAEGLHNNDRLAELLITPSTKGVLTNIPGVPALDDINISRQTIVDNWQAFGFNKPEDINHYEQLLVQGFNLISRGFAKQGQVFVDTKFEFGYAKNIQGDEQLIYIDEVGTPDSSRLWDQAAYQQGQIVEQSKEYFRQYLLKHIKDADILTNKNRMAERSALAKAYCLPKEVMVRLSETYVQLAEQVIGHPLALPENPQQEIIDILNSQYQLIK
jgi:phosphoribosylaminoimidazole-succinocarboxamide synthase